MSVNQLSRWELLRKVLGRYLAALLILGAMLFLPAGTIFNWEAWAYLAILFIPMLLVLLYLIKNKPDLLERRMRMREKEAEQKLIIKLSYLYFLAAFLLPGFDQRYGWSTVRAPVVVMADMIVLLGYAIFFLALKENRYASRIVEVEQQQRVITAGPYALVRHPMYLAASLMYIFPLWHWGLIGP